MLKAFFVFDQRRLVERFEPDQQAAAAASRRQIQQFVVPCDRRRGQAAPLDLQRHQRGEQLLRIGDVGDQVEIEEDDAPSRASAGCRRRRRPPAFAAAAPCRRHDAELALIDASARRFERVGDVDQAGVEELALGKRQVRQLQRRDSGRSAAPCVPRRNRAAAPATTPRHSRPPCCRHGDRFFGIERRVDAADHDGNAAGPERAAIS